MDGEYRLYTRVIDWCSMCPAHHCNLETEAMLCRCYMTNKIIPTSTNFGEFPSWCPLVECTESGRKKKVKKE